MEFDNQIAMPIIFAFAIFFAFLPLVIMGLINTKVSLYILLLGLATLPINLLWLVGVREIPLIDAITLNFEGGIRFIVTSYYIGLLGFAFTVVSLVRGLFTSSSNKSLESGTQHSGAP